MNIMSHMRIIIILLKITLLSWALIIIFSNTSGAQVADAGEDKVIINSLINNEEIIIGGGNEIPGYCYHWSPEIGLSDPHILHPVASPEYTTTYTLTMTGPDFSSKSSDQMTVTVSNAEINQVGFTGDHTISIWPSEWLKIDYPDGSSPVWGGPISYPVCYTQGVKPTIWGKILFSNNVNCEFSLRIRKGSDILAESNGKIYINGNEINTGQITFDTTLSNSVRITNENLIWEIEIYNEWIPIGTSGPHKFYWTYADPISLPFGYMYPSKDVLYDMALEKACGYVNGGSDLFNCNEKIAQGMDYDIFYNPARDLGPDIHPLEYYSWWNANSPWGIQCENNAILLRGLMRSIGIDGVLKYFWAGLDAQTYSKFGYHAGNEVYGASFRIIKDQHDGASLNPHFKYHTVVYSGDCNNAPCYFDASYGLLTPFFNILTFDETCPDNPPQQIQDQIYQDSYDCQWICPH
jgi:hypothetical protein